jgi:hypothetical protein
MIPIMLLRDLLSRAILLFDSETIKGAGKENTVVIYARCKVTTIGRNARRSHDHTLPAATFTR